MKVFVSDWRAGDGVSGYCAVMECKSVQEERPSCVTSGGQSVGRAAGAEAGFLVDLAIANQEETSVQVRQL